jgi:hypothetical protein
VFPDLHWTIEGEKGDALMAQVSPIERIAPAARVHAAILGATLTALALVGGLMGGLIGGSFTFHGLIGKASNPLTYTLAAIVFGTGILSGSALWGVGMARLARYSAVRRAAWASILGFVPITILLNFGLLTIEPIAVRADLPVHRLFTVLFVPTALMIASTSSLALGWALGWGRAAPLLALRVGLTAALAFLIVNLGMEVLGWQIGAPEAEERGTMITVLIAGNLGAALAGGAMLGMSLTQRHSRVRLNLPL